MAASANSYENSQQTEEPVVWIMVLHYQGADCTVTCLNSLRALKYRKFHVLLLDNGSPDRSGDEIARSFPEFSYVRLEENLGFAGGCNEGVRYCTERGAQWVWLLNNDTRVAPDSLRLMIAEAAKSDKAALLGAMVYTPLGEQFVASGAGEIDFMRGKTLMRKQVPSGVQSVSCEWLSGCNLLLRTDAFWSVKGFDEDYFLYFEDTDLCYRMREAGWDCVLVPDARVEHIGGASTEGKLSIWRMYYYTRNRLLFFVKHTKGAAMVPMLLAISAHLARHYIVLPFRGEAGKRQLKAEMLGLRDYMDRRFGKATCLDW